MGPTGMAIGATVALGAAVAVVGYESLKMAANFESATTRLITSAGESHANIDMVRKGMIDMAGQVGVSAQDLAKAMYTVESGTFHGADALKVLRASVEGAKAENADLTAVTNATTTALVDYHLSADHAAEVTTKMVAATSAGKTTFEELTGAMHSVLPNASAAHIALEDILGSLAAMTVHGMSAQQAAQNLNDVIRHMQAPTAVQAKELALLGMTTNQLADDLKSKGLSGTLQEISDKIRALSPPGTDKVILDLKTALNGLSPAVREVALSMFDGHTTAKEYIAASKALDPISQSQAMSFKTLAGSMHRIGDEQMTGAQVMQNYGQALYKATGDATGLNVALMLTGDNAGVANAAVKTVKDATVEAGNHVKGWSDIQATLNQQIAEFKAGLESVGIKIGDFLMPKVKDIIKIVGDFASGLKDIFKDSHGLDDLSAKLDKLWQDILPEVKKSFDGILKAVRDNKDGLEKLGKFLGEDVVPLLAVTLPVSLKILTAMIEGTIAIWGLLGQAIEFFKGGSIMAIRTFAEIVLAQFDYVLTGIDKLINAIPGVPKSWKTGLDNAVKDFHNFRDGILHDIDSLDGKTANIYIHGHVSGTNLIQSGDTYSVVGGGVKLRAEGGPVEPGQPYIVGERGPELVVPNMGAHVFTAAQTRQILAGSSQRAFSAPSSNSAGSGGGGPIVVQLVADGRKLYEVIVPHAQRYKGRNTSTALV
jgi:hypothetical protein